MLPDDPFIIPQSALAAAFLGEIGHGAGDCSSSRAPFALLPEGPPEDIKWKVDGRGSTIASLLLASPSDSHASSVPAVSPLGQDNSQGNQFTFGDCLLCLASSRARPYYEVSVCQMAIEREMLAAEAVP
jgi:hypothetical protein